MINLTSTYHPRTINLASTYQQRMINVSSTHDQRNVNVSSTYHQPSINVSTAHDQCIISLSSTSHHLARKIHERYCTPPTPPDPKNLKKARPLRGAHTVCLSVCLSVHLPDSKRSSSARLPHVSNLTTSKTDQFCDTSFIPHIDVWGFCF